MKGFQPSKTCQSTVIVISELSSIWSTNWLVASQNLWKSASLITSHMMPPINTSDQLYIKVVGGGATLFFNFEGLPAVGAPREYMHFHQQLKLYLFLSLEFWRSNGKLANSFAPAPTLFIYISPQDLSIAIFWGKLSG